MKELKIRDILGRHIMPGNIVAYHLLTSGGHVFRGVFTVVETAYLPGSAYELKLVNFHDKHKRSVFGTFYNDQCFGDDNLVIKIAEGAHAL